jgi:hypothetical protein
MPSNESNYNNKYHKSQMLLTGKQFNEKYKNEIFVKLTNETETHNGFQFKTGLNIDPIDFNSPEECKAVQLYFYNLNNLAKWLRYKREDMKYMRYVTIPDDAKVYVEVDKVNANKIILSERNLIYESEIWNNTDYQLSAIKQSEYVLKYIKNQTDEICLEAVKQNGYALRHVSKQTNEICLAAVNQEGDTLSAVENQTDEICLAAVRQNGFAIQYVKNQTNELCLEAVKENGCALEYVNNQTAEICLEAVKENKIALKYVNIKVREYVIRELDLMWLHELSDWCTLDRFMSRSP